jgi:VWFA-related protein
VSLEPQFFVEGSHRAPRRASRLWVVSILLVAGAASAAQAPQGPSASHAREPGAPPRFSVRTSSVVLDVVVRDRMGLLVGGLTAADFEVREDGTRQSLESFRVVAPLIPAASPVFPGLGAESPTAGPLAEAAPVLALVFDRMSATGRDLARRSASAYLASAPGGATFIGVFAIDLALHTVQPYTRDQTLIAPAVERAASYGHTTLASASTRTRVRDQIDAMAKAEGRLASSAQASAGGVGTSATASLAGQTALAKARAEMEVRLQRNLESLERTQQGYATLHGLEAVVATLAGAPGRKTVLLFSEGLALPANVEPQFRALVANANEANVSFYGMDAGGLRIASPTAETGLELRQAGERRLRQMQGAGDLAMEGSMMKQLERSEDLLRLDPRSGLGQLADETGGFLIRDSNDAAAALRRIEEDMRFHYVLSYSPTNDRFDGHFRRIAVRVRHRGVIVQTRKGYVASPGSTWRSGS